MSPDLAPQPRFTRTTAPRPPRRLGHWWGLRNVAIIAMAAIFLFSQFIVPIILPTQANDATTIAEMATDPGAVDAFDGYAAMSRIYGLTSPGSRDLIITVFAIAVIYLLLWRLRAPRFLVLGCFILTAPIVLYLPFFIKDTFTVPVVVISMLVLTSRNIPIPLKIAIVAASYTIYALIFRQYFLLIAAIWLALIVFVEMPWRYRIATIIVSMIILVVSPNDLYNQLQIQRDTINFARAGFAGSGNRTAFINLVRPDGMVSFLINYAYAAYRLNLPILDPGPKEIYLIINVAIYSWLVITGIRSGNRYVVWPTLLFLAQVLTIIIFEPDLGSYIRHLSTSVLLLAPSLTMHDRIFQRRHFAPMTAAASREVGAAEHWV